MRELTPWLIIVSLAITNAAPPNTVSQDSSADKLSKSKNAIERSIIYVETIPEPTNTYNTYSCDLNLNLGDNLVYNDSVQTFGYSRVVLSLKVENDSKIFSVNMKNCNAKELTLDVFSEIREIAFRDDKYYVMFWDATCREFYCIAIYNSDGKIIKAATPLVGIYASYDIRMEINNKGLLINGFGSDAHVNLHFISYDDLAGAKLLFFVPHGRWFGLSTADDKLGFCAFDDGKTVVNASKKIVCEQYDADGKIKMMSTEIQIGKDDHAEFVKAGNLDKGMMLMIVEWQSQGLYNPIKHFKVVYIDEHGKQGNRNDIDVKCEDDIFPQFYKNSIGEYCVSYICASYNQLPVPYTKCFKKSELV